MFLLLDNFCHNLYNIKVEKRCYIHYNLKIYELESDPYFFFLDYHTYKEFVYGKRVGNHSLSFDDFSILQNSNFRRFFVNNRTKVPNVFKPYKSYYRYTYDSLFYKLVSILSRDGKFLRFYNLVNSEYSSIYYDFFNYKFNRTSLDSENGVFFFFYYYNLHYSRLYESLNKLSEEYFMRFEDSWVIKSDLYSKFFFFDTMKRASSIFLLKSFKVNKTTWKRSRGLSGKYKYKWKFVPFMKRNSQTLR